MMRKKVSIPLRLSPRNSVPPARRATDAIATLIVAAQRDHLDPQVPPVKLELLVIKEKPVHPDAPAADPQSPFRPLDAVCAPLDLLDPLAPLDPQGPTAKPAPPATLEAMERLETLEPLEAPEPLETLAPLDPLDQPDQPVHLEPSANLDLLDPKDHLELQARQGSLGTLGRTVPELLDPKEHRDPLALLEAMEKMDPRDLLELLGLLERTRSIALAQAKESVKWRRRCRWDAFGRLFFSLVLPFLFVEWKKIVV